METKPTLAVHEWIAVLLIAAFLVFTSVITYMRTPSWDATAAESFHAASQIAVTVAGEVRNPGTFALEKGATIRDLLNLAEPLPTADLRRVKYDSKVRPGQRIVVKRQGAKKAKGQ